MGSAKVPYGKPLTGSGPPPEIVGSIGWTHLQKASQDLASARSPARTNEATRATPHIGRYGKSRRFRLLRDNRTASGLPASDGADAFPSKRDVAQARK